MFGRHFSVILLPTNKCNVACDYCFEDKTDDFMSIEMLDEIIEKLLDHMDRKDGHERQRVAGDRRRCNWHAWTG